MNVVDKLSNQSSQNKSAIDKVNEMIDGESLETKSMKNLIAMVSQTDSTALILGEPGTGKDILAQAIHKCSNKKGPFITVNCAAIPSELLESELFGHEKGAFTGATSSRAGYFEVADGGTIFLDEVGELPLSPQVRLLRVLESGEFIRVGSSKSQKTDVRIVAATNVNMREAISKGKFREDLYYSLSTV